MLMSICPRPFCPAAGCVHTAVAVVVSLHRAQRRPCNLIQGDVRASEGTVSCHGPTVTSVARGTHQSTIPTFCLLCLAFHEPHGQNRRAQGSRTARQLHPEERAACRVAEQSGHIPSLRAARGLCAGASPPYPARLVPARRFCQSPPRVEHEQNDYSFINKLSSIPLYQVSLSVYSYTRILYQLLRNNIVDKHHTIITSITRAL